MRSTIDTATLHAFVDGELDALASRAIEDRLAQDDALRARVAMWRQLRGQVAESADYHAAPPALRERLAAIAREDALPAPQPRRAVAARPGWFAWRPLGASLALVAIGAVGLTTLRENAGREDRLADEVVASHVRATLGDRLVDVASSDHHTVKPWLSARLDFSPPVPDVPLPGTPFIGGRIDYLAGQPVAALVFRHGQHVVSSFVWPADGPDRAVETRTERGFRIAHWTHARMAHWAISDVNRVEFDALVQALVAAD